MDYYGVFGNLNDAIEIYTEFDQEDLVGTYTDISDEVAKLPQRHSEVWDILRMAKNQNDLEAYGELLCDEEKRVNFYEKVTAYARTLKIALSSIEFHKTISQEHIDRYKSDLTMFLKLRRTVQARYSDTIDFSQYEGQIQKLIDTHIESGEVQIITDLVNIFDKEKFAEEVEKIMGKVAKADTISSRTAKYITESMDTDPAFFKKFSKMLEETIEEYRLGRISEAEYLQRAEEIMQKVLSRTDSEIPESLQNNNAGRAYFGLCLEVYKRVCKESDNFNLTELALITANKMDEIIRTYIYPEGSLMVDWTAKDRLIGTMKLDIEDYLIDEIKRKYGIPLTFDDMDSIIDNSVDVASKWFR